MKQRICLSLLLLLTYPSKGQFFESGQDPASIKWMQIKTANFQIIYPSTFDSAANKLANSLEYLYNPVAKTLNHKPKKISVILHTHSANSNGFVTWAPKRMELYSTPSQNSYGQDWLDQLAIHELRHVVQIDKLNQGLTRIAGILFGEQAIGAVTGLVPRWFYEGDAVYTETALSSTGRGRQGSFTMEMKSLLIERPKPYSYEKMLLGSYKDYVPNQYNFGYAFVAYNRNAYSDSLFEKNLNFTARNPYYPFAFNRSFKKQTSLSDISLYKQTYHGLKKNWSEEIGDDTYANTMAAAKKNGYTNYRFPHYINDTTLFAVKSGLDQLRQFILLYKSGKEKVLHTPGTYQGDRISVTGNKIVWAEEIPHVRWGNASYSNIKTMDIASGKVRMLTHKARYFAPSLSPDLNQLVCVKISVENNISLAFIHPQSGNLLMEARSPDNALVQDPTWSKDGKSIVAVLSGKKGKALYQYIVETDKWEEIIPWSYQNISMPYVSGKYIFYSSDAGGTNNIYAIDTETKKIRMMIASKYGAFDPVFNENESVLLFADYTSQGFTLKYKTTVPEQLPEHDINLPAPDPLLIKGISQEQFNFQDSVMPSQKFVAKRYSKLLHTINIHSWTPFYYDYDNLSASNQTIDPGFTILSQDKLGTCLSSFGVAIINGSPVYKTNITYKGWFPVVNFSMDYGEENFYTSVLTPAPMPLTSDYHMVANTQIYVPLNLTRGKYLTALTPFVNWEYDNWKYLDRTSVTYIDALNTLSAGLIFHRYLRLSYRDIAPRLGVSLNSTYYFKPFKQDVFGERSYAKAKVYLPGLFKHHSLQIAGGHYIQKPADYMFKSSLAFPRGYTTYAASQLNIFTSDYTFPLLYPDFHVGRLLYLKRIRSNLFADWGKAEYSFRTKNIGEFTKARDEMLSTGLDITTDSHILRIIFPVSFGVRTIYFPNEQKFSTYIIFGINFNY